ncbi:lytic transglycosylase domain-containing protein [Jonesia quinghaiensis]|uniref:lytic transglycosylase domain-containing protein n=1 Tax=Jonesia quinghaiensis TaxID=262806 RepID=UPI000688FFA5|nr:lytic murein transglycosylase [Jonesia quinghaiensis]
MPNHRRVIFFSVITALCVTGVGALIQPHRDSTPFSGDVPSTGTSDHSPTPPHDASLSQPAPASASVAGQENPPVQFGGETTLGDLVEPQWVSAVSTATGIPPLALTAYAGASIAQAQTTPQCNLGWNTLAGIGEVESHHGTINESLLDESGTATPPIIGVALNGDGVAAIPDTDAGQVDGDTQWDRAVGPMQFIPQTWATFAQDGNGDGVQDPQNIYDAALAAAAYLCSTGGDLRESDQWIAAVNTYNNDVQYNNDVASAANRYAQAATTQ